WTHPGRGSPRLAWNSAEHLTECLMFPFLRSLRTRSQSRQNPRRTPPWKRATCRLMVEALEDRLAPATVNWVAGSADWRTVSNRSEGAVNRLPGMTPDTVLTTNGIAVTHSPGSDTVESLTPNAALSLTGATPTVPGTVQDSSPLTLAGGTLAQAPVAAGTTVVG